MEINGQWRNAFKLIKYLMGSGSSGEVSLDKLGDVEVTDIGDQALCREMDCKPSQTQLMLSSKHQRLHEGCGKWNHVKLDQIYKYKRNKNRHFKKDCALVYASCH